MLFKALLLILCAPGFLLAQEAHLSNYGGVNNFADSMMIADSDAQSASNVLTDEGDLRTIYGNSLYAVIGSSSISFFKEWTNSSGQRLAFAKSGLSIYATDPSSGGVSAITTLSGERDIDMVAAFDRAYFADGSAPFYTTGSSVTTAPGMESCKYIEYYQTRLVCVNTTTETSRVALSTYNNPDNWTTTSSKDSAAVKYYKKGDGEGINCVFTTPGGVFIGKDSSVGMLKGDNNETFYWKNISEDVGCSDDRTVQVVDGELVWLSKNGFYSYDYNAAPKPISLKIANSTKLIRKSLSTESLWTVNTKSSWEEGTGTGWDYNIFPGSIKARVFNSGVLTAGAASYIRYFEGAGFEQGNSTAWTPVFDSVAAMPYTYEPTYPSGLYVASDDLGDYTTILSSATFEVLNASDDVMISSMVLTQAPGWYSLAPVTGTGNIKLKVTNRIGGTHISTAYDRALGASIYYTPIDIVVVGAHYHDVFDCIELSSAMVTSISVSSNTWLTTPEYSVDFKGGNATLNWYASDDNITFVNTTVPLPGGSINAAYHKRYYKYNVTMSSGVTVSSFTSLTVSVFSTSTYLSDVHFTASDIAAWRLFVVSDVGSVTPVYSVRSASYAFASDGATPTFTTQPENSTVVVSTGQYVQFRISPDTITSTDSLRVSLVSTAYTVGQESPRAASVVNDHRYIASVSHNSSTANDITYIWQKNKEWTFSDQGYGALGNYNYKPMGGSTGNSSKVWNILDPDSYSFDGVSINSSWVTKDFTFGAVNNHKVINKVWITAENNGLADFGIAWQANRDGVWNSTSTTLTTSDFIIKQVDGLFEEQYPARQIRFKFTADTLDKYFRLKLYSVYYNINPLIR